MEAVNKLLDGIREEIKSTNDPSTADYLERLLKEYEDAGMPWWFSYSLILPDWSEVWFAVDGDNEAGLYDLEPIIIEENWSCRHPSTTFMFLGYWKIPEGLDWKSTKVRIK